MGRVVVSAADDVDALVLHAEIDAGGKLGLCWAPLGLATSMASSAAAASLLLWRPLELAVALLEKRLAQAATLPRLKGVCGELCLGGSTMLTLWFIMRALSLRVV